MCLLVVLSIYSSLQQERWFRKHFYSMENPGREGTIGMPELKKFMQKISYKITTSALKERFSKFDTANSGDISFDDFLQLLSEILFDRALFKVCLLMIISGHGFNFMFFWF